MIIFILIKGPVASRDRLGGLEYGAGHERRTQLEEQLC